MSAMNRPDPRLDATRTLATEAALQLLQDQGMLAVTHAAISNSTGISRSTLYRHWPKLEDLRNATIARAATTRGGAKGTQEPAPEGPLNADLHWIIGRLMTALNETPWGKIAPHVIAAAATEAQTRALLGKWIADRSQDVRSVFEAAIARGEIGADAPVSQMIELAIAVPYFRKFVAGSELDRDWLDRHVALICEMAAEGRQLSADIRGGTLAKRT